MWISDSFPTESGYYLTVYFNHENSAWMRKAFWYDVEGAKWVFRFDPEVKCWWDVRYDHYAPCQMQEVPTV